MSLWNANGLRATTVHEVLSHCFSSSLLFITETWLLSPSLLPTDWMQYHVYGVPVASTSRGSMGVTALVNPSCPYTITQLPSANRYTLSLKVGPFRVHCVYVPPPLSNSDFLSVLSSIPSLPNTIICRDFNARLGDLTGDHLVSARGRSMLQWLSISSFEVLNGSLARGVPTWLGFRDGAEMSSVIDLFLTNSSLVSPCLDIASDLSLGSDHRLLHLSFSFDPLIQSEQDSSALPGVTTSSSSLELVPSGGTRSLQALSRYVSFSICSPNLSTEAVGSTPSVFLSLDSSVGDRPPRPSHWKKYWTSDLQASADRRNMFYRRWRRASGIDKVFWWNKHQQANISFRQAVATAKRLSWQAYCKSLESDFIKATAKVKQLKRRHQSSASFSHPDGPSKAVEVMATHLASVYDGSLLPSTRPPLIPTHSTPFSLGFLAPYT
ncbi:hypothetical protein G6F56_010990 [Rhizopus delemar]|nr:hypothetical protein G6F56_010990 [Rhizopus delemar]